MSNAAYKIMKRKFDYAFQALKINENVKRENLIKDFEAYCQELIVIKFDSALFDWSLIKLTLIPQLLNKIDFVIKKKTNKYLCIQIMKWSIFDIHHFLPSGSFTTSI